jgi:hypothetical protein
MSLHKSSSGKSSSKASCTSKILLFSLVVLFIIGLYYINYNSNQGFKVRYGENFAPVTVSKKPTPASLFILNKITPPPPTINAPMPTGANGWKSITGFASTSGSTLVAKVYIDNRPINTLGSILATVVTDNKGQSSIRGTSNLPNYNFGNWGRLFSAPVNVKLNEVGTKITVSFKVYDAETKKIYTLNETITYTAGTPATRIINSSSFTKPLVLTGSEK